MAFQVPRILGVPVEFDAPTHLNQLCRACIYFVNMPGRPHFRRSVFNIFAFVDVPIVIFSIKWWRTQHPQPVFWGGGSIDPAMRTTALLNLLALALLGAVLVLIRLRQEEVQREIDSMRRYAHAM